MWDLKVLNLKVFSLCLSAFSKDKAGPIRPALTDTDLLTVTAHQALQGLMGTDLCVCLPISLHCLQSQPTISMHSATDEAQNGVAIWHAYIREAFFNSMLGGGSDWGSLRMQLLWLSEGKASILPLSHLFSSWFAKRLSAWAFLWHS